MGSKLLYRAMGSIFERAQNMRGREILPLGMSPANWPPADITTAQRFNEPIEPETRHSVFGLPKSHASVAVATR
jgi:hypothetical protein